MDPAGAPPLRPAGRVLPVLAVLAVGALCWLPRLGINDLEDAGSNEVRFSRESVATLLFDMRWPDQSPLYFLALKAWKPFGETPGAVRSLYVVFLLAALAALYRLALAWSPRRDLALGATVAFAFSPLALWLARSGRMYGLLTALALAGAAAVVRHGRHRRPRDAVLAVVLLAAAIYTHFFGFAIAGVLAAWRLREAWTETPRRRGLRAPLAAGAALAIVTLPQAVRLVRLLLDPLARNRLSLPPDTHAFLERLGRFLFLPSSWSGSGTLGLLATAGLAALIAVLLLRGLAVATPSFRRYVLLWCVLPVVAATLLAGHLDLRERYFVFVAPVAWLAVARGVFGPDGAARSRVTAARAAPLLAGLLVLYGLKAQTDARHGDRSAEWVKALRALAALDPGDALHATGRGPYGAVPQLAAEADGLVPPLGPIEPYGDASRGAFLDALRAGRPVVLYRHLGHRDPIDVRFRSIPLERGWKRTEIRTHGALIDVYSPEPLPGFARVVAVPGAPDPDALVAWARTRRTAPGRGADDPNPFTAALVAAAEDGVVREAAIFASQRGENGGWWFGPDGDRDSVHEETDADGTTLYAWAVPGRRVVVAWPSARPRHVSLTARRAGRARLRADAGVGLAVGPGRPAAAGPLDPGGAPPVLLLDAGGDEPVPVTIRVVPGLE